MDIGVSQVDISPAPGAPLCGFALRLQPSEGLLDPLYARTLYLTDGATHLLWIHCDLIGFSDEIVRRFRAWAQQHLELPPSSVLLTATHTHSGPATLNLWEAGEYDHAYADHLMDRLRTAARAAIARQEPCSVSSAIGHTDLAVNRRADGAGRADHQIGALGFRRANGEFVAAVVNYPVHPVALGCLNRKASADIPGRASAALSSALPGNPVVLVTNGACGDLNPPAENVPFEQVQTWGRRIADAIAPGLLAAAPQTGAEFVIQSCSISLPLDVLDGCGIAAAVRAAGGNREAASLFGQKFKQALQHWSATLAAELETGRAAHTRRAELFAVTLGGLVFLGVNAEVFSAFTEWMRRDLGACYFTLGYANGNMGYLAPEAAYAQGGYEIEMAHVFYGSFRFKAGALEALHEQAVALLRAPATSKH